MPAPMMTQFCKSWQGNARLLRAATILARSNAVDAYRVAISGGSGAIDPTSALVQYQNAKALQQFAEQALLTYLLAQGNSDRDPPFE